MISAETVLIFGVALFILGMAARAFFRLPRWGWPTTSLYVVGCILCGWVLIAANIQPAANDVTYHDIQQRPLNDGTAVDFIMLKDSWGNQRLVNINKTLGVKVLGPSQRYRVARVQYNPSMLGLSFHRPDSYKLVDAPN